MAHAQKPDFVFRRNGRVHLHRRGRQVSRLLAAEVCASALIGGSNVGYTCSEVVRRVLATHSIRQFPHHFPSHASPSAITFQLESTNQILIGTKVLLWFCQILARKLIAAHETKVLWDVRSNTIVLVSEMWKDSISFILSVRHTRSSTQRTALHCRRFESSIILLWEP
jgi:hypothetical protein